jgi:hypothetical protein
LSFAGQDTHGVTESGLRKPPGRSLDGIGMCGDPAGGLRALGVDVEAKDVHGG